MNGRRRRKGVLDLLGGPLGWFVALLFRYRRGLSPIWTALVCAAAAWLLWSRAPEWWAIPVSAALVLATTIVLFGAHLSPRLKLLWLWLVPDALDDGKRGVLDRPPERCYLALLVLSCGSWISWATEDGWTQAVWTTWLAGAFAFGAPWWWHRRIRHRVNKYVRRWPAIETRVDGFRGSKVTVRSSSPSVTELLVRLSPTKTIDDVGRTSLQLASGFGLRGGAVTLSEDTMAARNVLVRIVPRDPWESVIHHPMPSIGSLDLTQPGITIPSGVFDDQTVQTIDALSVTGVIGQRGSGKSSWIESWLGSITAADPSLYALIGIDMGGGATLGTWEEAFAAPIATNAATAQELLQALIATGESRERTLDSLKRSRRKHGNVLPITPEFPVIYVTIDELPSLMRDSRAVEALALFLQRFRKVNLYAVLAGQNPTEHDFGSTELRAQIENLVGMRLDARQSQTLWGAQGRRGWDSTMLPRYQHLLNSHRYTTPRIAKGFYVSPAARDQRLADLRAVNTRSALDPVAMAAFAQHVPSMVIEDAGRPQLSLVKRELDPNAELDAAVLQALVAKPLGATEIAQLVAASRDRVNRSLARLEKAGDVRHVGTRWARATSS